MLLPVASADAAAPKIRTLVVFKDGSATSAKPSASVALVRVGKRKRCAVGARTPLAALVRSKPGKIGVRDYAACSRRPRDGSGLFVKSIRANANRGQSGWVYKVDRKLGTAGAADPLGPFGNGLLRSGQRVTWFYCRTRTGACQRTLELRPTAGLGGAVTVKVRGYDNDGKGAPVEAATVSTAGGGVTGTTDATGTARLTLPVGTHTLIARRPGTIRSFAERVTVR